MTSLYPPTWVHPPPREPGVYTCSRRLAANRELGPRTSRQGTGQTRALGSDSEHQHAGECGREREGTVHGRGIRSFAPDAPGAAVGRGGPREVKEPKSQRSAQQCASARPSPPRPPARPVPGGAARGFPERRAGPGGRGVVSAAEPRGAGNGPARPQAEPPAQALGLSVPPVTQPWPLPGSGRAAWLSLESVT